MKALASLGSRKIEEPHRKYIVYPLRQRRAGDRSEVRRRNGLRNSPAKSSLLSLLEHIICTKFPCKRVHVHRHFSATQYSAYSGLYSRCTIPPSRISPQRFSECPGYQSHKRLAYLI